MENNTVLPFERNRYYVGKLLTSSDFLAEQTYFNNKRRFINSMMFGTGVVCGLSVYNLDDISIIIESGVAIDGAGREIVVESSVIRKLSAIEGFSELLGDRAHLMLRYKEELLHPVYSVARQEQADDEYELNRIREGWELYLTDAESKTTELPSEFLNTAQLYSDEDYDIDVSLPTNVSVGAQVKLTLAVKKKTDADLGLSLDCTMQTPAFLSPEGDHELHVYLDNLSLAEGETVSRSFLLTAAASAAPGSLIVAKSNFIKLTIGGQQKRPEENFLLNVNVVDIPICKLIEQELGKINLEARNIGGAQDAVLLAELSLQRSKNEYIVEKIADLSAKNYIHTAAAEHLRREFSSYFEGPAPQGSSGMSSQLPEFLGGPAPKEPLYATGVCEIPLGSEVRQNEIVFSDEIMHGLGKGNLYVDVGFEYLDVEKRTGEQAKHIIYGNPSLFAKDEPPIAFAETAVKVYDERGSFMIAARLTRPTNYVVLVLRWVAFRLPSESDQSPLSKITGKSISAVPPTAVIGTRESHYFAVRFKNMEPCTVTYELTEKDSGEISSDGIYTAPSKEGVYEIRISCADLPMISTYAYAVVKKKPTEKQE